MRIGSLLRSKTISVGFIVTTTLLITLSLQSWGVFSRIELASFDHRVELFRSDREINENVVIVLIDDVSLQELNQDYGRWPWPRAIYAELIDFFALAGAQGLAFDILFSEQQDVELTDGNDQQLVEATLTAGNVVHAMQLLHADRESSGTGLPEEFRQLFGLDADHFAGPAYNDALLPFEFLYLVSQGSGFVEIVPDRDGVYRRIRLFNRHSDGTVLPSLAAALVLPLFGAGNSIGSGLDAAQFAASQVPLDGRGNYLINPYGRVQTVPIAQVIRSMRQIRAGDVDNPELDPAQFNGKLVLLGASAIGLLDVKATALGAKQAGVLLHAYTVSNLLEQDFLTTLDGISELALLLFICCFSAIPILLASRLSIAVLLPVAIGIVYLAAVYIAFPFNLVMPVTPIVFTQLLSLMLALMIRSYRQSLLIPQGASTIPASSRSRLEGVRNDPARLEASRESLSAMSVGIRDVSGSRESRDPGQVVASLNLCIAELAGVVNDNGGTIDQVIGDSITAYWGTAGNSAGHPQLALECARQLCQQLPSINEKLAAHQYSQVDLSIGIHSGKAVLGNIGIPGRYDYGSIGADVDLARQLQVLCAQYDCPILLSESTRRGLQPTVSLSRVDELKISNNTDTFTVYTLNEPF